MAARRPLALVVLDGWGIRERRDNNAIAMARTPVFDELAARFPFARLTASGESVGLPAGQMGNSEVGHMNMGAGRVVYQDLTRIDKAVGDGALGANAALSAAFDLAVEGGGALHFVGLLSDGGVHSHQNHLFALLDLAGRRALPRVFVHAITDGRDASPNGTRRYLGQLDEAIARAGTGRLATLCGRYYAMDRDKRWERTERAYNAMTRGNGTRSIDPRADLEASYARGVTDEFLEPIVCTGAEGQPVALVKEGDVVIFFNFRADRARQLTQALAFDDFSGFTRKALPRPRMTTMTRYDASYGLPVIFEPQSLTGSLAEVLAAGGATNLRLAETEKYAHVTYFFNCGEERPYAGEERILVPSAKVATYDLQPEMSAAAITDVFVAGLARRAHDVIICNFANADMVGHTGSIDATVRAVETLDACLGRMAAAVRAAGGRLIVTADHGNAEQMWDDELNAPHTAHTSNPVPIMLVDFEEKGAAGRVSDGALCDVAPTMLGLLDLPLSEGMTGRDLRKLKVQS
ncbi:MAG: 2,3-bisphosphoglycerate-independent phosphoglycerate mutase [Acidobacteriota bacterium]|nr:2,3-bisphosphoglycerate-independent phosphoglycerate mutase [Acidobacteriota bacterium]